MFNNCGELIPYSELNTHYLSSCKKINFAIKYKELEEQYEKEKQRNKSLLVKNSELLNELNINEISLDIKDNFFLSNYHPHPLLKGDENRHATCDICKESIYSPIIPYFCNSCNFDICSICINREKEDEEE